MTAEPPAPTCYRHGDRETWISCGRCGRPICPECMVPASVGFQCPECVKEGARTTRSASTVVGAPVGAGGAPVTYTLIGANVLLFLLTWSFSTNSGNRLFRDLVLVSFQGQAGQPSFGVADGEWYRLVSAAFLHYGLFHLAANMYALFALGPALEQLLGRWRYAAVYALAGLGGSVATYLFSPLTQSAGASGAVFGLFAAFFVLARRIGADTRQIVVVIAINLVATFAIPGISKTGHLGGLALGAAAAAVLTFAPTGPRRSQLQAGGLAALLALLVVATAVGPQ